MANDQTKSGLDEVNTIVTMNTLPKVILVVIRGKNVHHLINMF